MAPDLFLERILRPGLDELEAHGGPRRTREAERWLIAVGLQESDLRHRYQHSPRPISGPAKGWWQFEENGVLGVLTHRASRELATAACQRHFIVPHVAPATRALEGHDRLAVIMARLLLWTHPRALPQTQDDGWRQYLDLWRPGRPRIERWAPFWRQADAITAAGFV